MNGVVFKTHAGLLTGDRFNNEQLTVNIQQ